MANADISLLFGVAGEGSLSGESGKLIQEQLTQIMTELNKSPLKVKVGIDAESGGKKSWSSQLQEKLDKLSASGKFSAQISTLKISASAVSDFKKQLTAIVNTVGLSTGTSITLTAEGIGEVKSKLKEAQDELKKTGEDASNSAKKLAEFKVQMEALSGQKRTVKKSLDSLEQSAATEEEIARVKEIKAEYEQWAVKIEEVNAAKEKAPIPTDQRAAIEAEGAAILDNIKRINEERTAREEAARAAEDAAKQKTQADRSEADSQGQRNSALRTGLTLLTQMERAERNWTAAQNGSSRNNYAGIQGDIARLKEYRSQLISGKMTVSEFREKLKELQVSFSENSNAIRAVGEDTRTLGSRLGTLAQKFSAWLSVSHIIMLGVRSIKQMVSATIELDDAMTQLKIVTRDTAQAYDEYLGKITQTATRIGSAIPDLIDSTTTFARLGYSLEESSTLAEFTAMLQNVGDIDVSDAQDAITAIVKAFKVDVSEIESVMDKLVITGNNFPISVAQIAEGMNNASSALAAAGNTFEQSVALLTAANTTVQNAAKASTGLRTIAARLRSTTTELDELGEVMTEAQYGELVSALTKYNVALTDINGEFRSTYDIMADIAAIWDSLTSMEQSGLASAIAGTRQQAIFFSMIEQFKEASGAMEQMANSAGTLRESYAIFMESTTAHINQFKAAFQSLSQTVISTDFLNDFIDLGTTVLGVLESIMKLVNAIGGLNTVLYTTAGILITINANSILAFISKLFTPLKNLVTIIQAINAGMVATNVTGKGLGKTVSVAFGEITLSATAAQLAVGALVAVIGVGILAYNSYRRSIEEARQAMNDAADAANEQQKSLENLINQYKALASAGDFDQSSREKARDIQQQITDLVGKQAANLDLVNGKLDEQIKKLNDISVETAQQNQAALDTKYRDAKTRFNDGTSTRGSPTNAITGLVDHYTDYYEALQNVGLSRGEATNLLLMNGENAKEVLNRYKEIQSLLLSNDAWEKHQDDGWLTVDHNELLNEIQSAIDFYQNVIDEYDEAQKNFFENEAIIDQFNFLKANDIDTQEAFDSYIAGIRSSTEYSEEYKDVLIELATKTFPEFAEAAGLIQSPAASAGGALQSYRAQLSDLAETMSKLKSSYDILQSAESEMADGGGLSPETIKALADAEKNYLDYLYEENGVVKLNIEAWKERSELGANSDISALQNEIDGLREQNVRIRENIDLYRERQALAAAEGNQFAYDILAAQIEFLTKALEQNNEELIECENRLKIVGAAYDSIINPTVDVWDFSSLVSGLDNVESSVSDIVSAMETLQKGTSLTVEELSKLALKYPDLLKVSNLFTDTSVANQKEMLNSILDVYEAEYDALIDTKIAELTATNELIQQQIALENEKKNKVIEIADLQSNGKLDSEAEYQKLLNELRDLEGKDFVTYSDGVLDVNRDMLEGMLEQQGDEVDSSKPIWGALGDMIVEGHTDGLSGALKAFPQYLTKLRTWAGSSLKTLLSNIGTNILKAFSGKTDFVSLTDGISSLGTISVGKVTIDTKIDESQYTIDGKSVGDWAAEYQETIEKRVQTLTEQITANETIIKNLERLKGLDLKSIYGSRGSSSGSGKNKEVKEYIASIDDYREAIERLNRIQIRRAELETRLSNEGDLKAQIELQKGLVEVYKEEQDALHTLNDLRDQTISSSAEALRAMGFEIEYDPDYNKFFVKNLEHINDLVADSKGKYDTLQEATNALRKDTEDLIKTLTELNDANQENSESWRELEYAIREAKIAIYENTVKERENKITLTENWLEAAIGKNETGRVKQYSNDIVSYYRDMQETIRQEAEYYRSLGYSDTSNEVSKLSDLWWEYENNIKEIKQNVVDYLGDIVTAASEMVDEIQNVFDVLKDVADEYAENGGFISVDSFQKIIELGPQYMQYLRDENGLLVINEESINRVIAAKTRQLAAEQAMTYVERLRLALQEGSIENLNTLLYATTEATNATFGLAYAELALMHSLGDLDDQQYAAALHNIQAIENLANTAIAGIGQTAGSAKSALEDMKSGVDDILKYVMDMLKHRIQQQIDALKDMKKAYSDIIDLRKEALDSAKKEAEYEDKVAEKVKQIAKLQERINALSLDDSRSAQAEKAKLEEELANLQKELADDQNEYAVDAQKEALDNMKEAYDDEKDAEIKTLEDTISSYQKLYDMAIEYIQSHWDTLYSELIAWNTQYGSVLNSEITTAWDNALAAARKYGSYVSALGSLNTDTASSGNSVTGSTNTTVGNKTTNTSSTNEDMVKTIVGKINELGMYWSKNNAKSTNDALHQKAVELVELLKQYGVYATYNPSEGIWWITHDEINPGNVGKQLKLCYHKGGIAGDEPTLKQNEVLAVLEKGEAVLDRQKEEGLFRLVEFATTLSDKFADLIETAEVPRAAAVVGRLTDGKAEAPSSISDNHEIHVEFGDTYIYGANEETVEKHRAITRQQANELLDQLNIKR